MKGAICLSLAGIIWGGLFLAVRLVVGSIEAVPLVWCRYILAFFALYAGTSILGTVEMLLYTIFWGIATMIVPMIKKP